MATNPNRSTSIFQVKGYERGMQVTSFDGLLMYQKNKFFFCDKLIDWSELETHSLRTLKCAMDIGQLHIARATSREKRLIDKNIRKRINAPRTLRTS